jgi:hypothetical protein
LARIAGQAVGSRGVARVLIVGGGCRGRRLASALLREGHAVRIVTRTETGRAAIEACGAECLIGDPGRLASLRGALDGVTIACWLLASATGDPEALRALHGPRLEAFMAQAIDSTMRGFVYEAPAGAADAADAPAFASAPTSKRELSEGERTVERMAARNAIPVAYVRADPARSEDAETGDAWMAGALSAIGGLLDPGRSRKERPASLS